MRSADKAIDDRYPLCTYANMQQIIVRTLIAVSIKTYETGGGVLLKGLDGRSKALWTRSSVIIARRNRRGIAEYAKKKKTDQIRFCSFYPAFQIILFYNIFQYLYGRREIIIIIFGRRQWPEGSARRNKRKQQAN